MKLLLFDPNAKDRETTARLLSGKHDVTCAADVATAFDALGRGQTEALVTELVSPGASGLELIKRFRARETEGHLFILATASRHCANDASEAFAAGADDFVRKPVDRSELLTRVEGMARVRRWAPLLFGSGGELPMDVDPCRLDAWRTIDASLCHEVAEMLGVRLSPVATSWPLEQTAHLAQIALQLPFDELEVVLSVGSAVTSEKTLASLLFDKHDVDTAMFRDALREIANTAGAAFKRAASLEGRTFTMGIPYDMAPWSHRALSPLAARQWVGKGEDGLQLCFEAEVRGTKKRLVPVTCLREGMVLAQDLLHTSGSLLLRGGTRLTQSQLERVITIMGAKTLVGVANAA